MSSRNDTREYWINVMEKIAKPVLTELSQRNFKESFPSYPNRGREAFEHLEALARTLVGIAPWLENDGLTGEEENLRKQYAELARASIDAGTDINSPDYMDFTNQHGEQPLVEAAFLSHAILRAPKELWMELDLRVRKQVVACLKQSRKCHAYFNNWLLFAAMVETCLYKVGEEWDEMRVDYAIRQHEQWYLGDGMYGDGPHFHMDYYNSFVIGPMLVDIVRTIEAVDCHWFDLKDQILKRAIRYAEIQERLISPEGTFPVIGRSLAYRFGAFTHLSNMALLNQLPEAVHPAQVRCALTAVIKKMIEAPGTFNDQGWLNIGFCGYQLDMAESYISRGSIYLCCAVFLPLGLSPEHDFWKSPEREWTSKRVWSGGCGTVDHALVEE